MYQHYESHYLLICTDGLDVQDFVSSLPKSVSPFLCEKLDWDHNGVEKDLDAIARTMSNWEAQFAVKLGLTRAEIEDIRAEKYALQRLVYDLRCMQSRLSTSFLFLPPL